MIRLLLSHLRYLLSPLALVVALASVAVAQPSPTAAVAPVDLYLDYATFMYDDEATLVEVYLAVEASSLTYTAGADGLAADLPLQLALRPIASSAPAGASQQPALERAVPLRFVVADTAALADGQFFFERVRATVAPGEYEMDVTLPATEGRPQLRLSREVRVRDYSRDDEPSISDLTLATDIRSATDASAPFYKNGVVVRPNPNGLFGEGQSRVFYYAEGYGLPEAASSGGYTLLAYVSEQDGPRPLPGMQRRSPREPRDPDVFAGALDVSALPSGAYYLRLAVLDQNNEPLVEASKKFFVLNSGVARPIAATGDEDFETNLYRAMSEEEVEENLLHAQVVATSGQLQQIRRLDNLDAKRAYLAQFWRGRDTDADPAQNAARAEFYRRLRYVERYRSANSEGYETDRGRTVLRYGEPSEVDPRPFESDLAPYEIWTYDNISGQGGRGLFIFADREGLNRYDLIHSTVIGEVTAPNWQEQLRR